MVAKNLKNYPIMLKIGVHRFIELPITYYELRLDSQNSIWRIQNDNKKLEKSSNCSVNLNTKVFWVDD